MQMAQLPSICLSCYKIVSTAIYLSVAIDPVLRHTHSQQSAAPHHTTATARLASPWGLIVVEGGYSNLFPAVPRKTEGKDAVILWHYYGIWPT